MSTYNPAGIGMYELRLMPKGARLLESDEERRAFAKLGLKMGRKENDMWVWLQLTKIWIYGATGHNPSSTYCTTKERDWWRVSINVDDNTPS